MRDTFTPAHAMLAALRDRRISSRELTELHLEQIDRHNPALIAIVVPADDPRAAAERADAARARGDAEQMLGLPITLKESINVTGMPTTVGVLDYAEFRATDDGAVARAVLGAGAVLLGKTNVAPMLGDWQSNNPIYGRTVNPWNPVLTPGIFGHKPSETAVPRSGQFPRPSRPNAGEVLDVQGPLARTAEDLELGMRAIAGPEVGEDVAWRLQLPPPRSETLAGLRVAIMPPIEWLPVSAEIRGALDTLATRLSRAGAKVRAAAPEAFGDMREHHGLYAGMVSAMKTAPAPREERDRQAAAMRASEDPWGAARAAGVDGGIVEWLTMHARREEFRQAYRDFFRDWDILLAPITLGTAWPHIDNPWPDGQPEVSIDVDGQQVPYGNQIVYPGLATLSGQPATAFPVGLSRDGLPLGLQAIGPYLEDYTSIRFAGLASREMGGFVPPPGFSSIAA